MRPIFVTGIGTGIGKTLVAAVVATALEGDYWKPVQAGDEQETDSEWIRTVINNSKSQIYPETYRLKMAVSPHIAARQEGLEISLEKILNQYEEIRKRQQEPDRPLVVEGAGGLLVPLNAKEFVIDLIKKLDARVILVSRNYLGSINHSLLTSQVCHWGQLDVAGWIFNDRYLDYEEEIVRWSGFPKLMTVPFSESPNRDFVYAEAERIRSVMKNWFKNHGIAKDH